MRYLVHSVPLLFALASILRVSAAPEPARNALEAQTVKEFSFHKSESANLKYLLFLPKGYGSDPAKRWPLMLFLHGAGERGGDIAKVTVHGPPKIVAQNPDFPFILVSPQCAEGKSWSKDILLGLLDEVSASLKVDLHRVYCTGLSMGGYGTWDLALSHPERFAAIVPICGGGELIDILMAEGQKKQALKTLGIWAFHGAKDPIVPPDESQRLVSLLKKVGVEDIKLTVYPEAGHDAWTETYNNPQLYEWLLGHERQ